MKTTVALLALPLFLLTGCTSSHEAETQQLPDQSSEVVESVIKLEGFPAFSKFANIPDSWKENAGDGTNPSFANNNGNCTINATTEVLPFSGMQIPSQSLTDYAYLSNFSYGAESDSAVKGTVTLSNFFGKSQDFTSYEFDGTRNVINDKGETDTKKSHTFLAMQGFNQKVEMGDGTEVTPIITIDVSCTNKENFNLDEIKTLVTSAEYTYSNTQNEEG